MYTSLNHRRHGISEYNLEFLSSISAQVPECLSV